MISMIVLYSRIPFVDQQVLEYSASQAWGFEFESGDEAKTFVAGESPLFLLRTDGRIYAINHCDRPCFDNVDVLAEETIENRTKHIVQNHTGWISIDLMGPRDDAMDVEAEYAMIGKLINQLINDDAMAILIPEFMRLIPWDDSMEPMLTGDDLLANLTTTHSPVFDVADDDPQMIVAVQQARSQWPQFVAAFENDARSEQSRAFPEQFAVKAPVSVNGKTEFIWITVTAIENQIIYGLLCNHPISLNGLAEGDRVRVPVDRLNDWIWSDCGQHYGGFTIKILNDHAKQKSLP